MPRKDPEKDKEYHKKYRQTLKYKEWHKIWAKEWRRKNPERWKQIYKASHKKNFESYKPRKNAYLRDYTKRKRQEALSKYGGKCTCCGEKIIEFLCFDHVNNDGNQHRKIIKSSRKFYYQLCKNEINESFQILCFNCNMGRQFFGGKEKLCPHKIKREY